MTAGEPGVQLLTVGHGTLSAGGLVELLRDAGVARVVDVRRHPGSRRLPHVAREALSTSMPAAGIAYEWAPDLGGRRRAAADSPHTALRNTSFRGYADWMGGDAFEAALGAVSESAERQTTAVMCAESLWWRCHRRLIADAVVLVHGRRVLHLRHDGRLDAHRVTDGARLHRGRLVYDDHAAARLPGL